MLSERSASDASAQSCSSPWTLDFLNCDSDQFPLAILCDLLESDSGFESGAHRVEVLAVAMATEAEAGTLPDFIQLSLADDIQIARASGDLDSVLVLVIVGKEFPTVLFGDFCESVVHFHFLHRVRRELLVGFFVWGRK
jgi:hypothetical protein